MPKCEFIKRKHRKVCIGDLDTLITLQSRDIVAPEFGNVDFDEDFQDIAEVYAMIETKPGETIFDGVDTEFNVTHEMTIRFDSSVTSETWVELDIRKFDIVSIENLEERNEWMTLFCELRGVGEAAKA